LRADLRWLDACALPTTVLFCLLENSADADDGSNDRTKLSVTDIVSIVCGCTAALIVLVVICAFIKVKGTFTLKLQRYFMLVLYTMLSLLLI